GKETRTGVDMLVTCHALLPMPVVDSAVRGLMGARVPDRLGFFYTLVSYRKGFLEITPNIHDGCINLETWGVHSEVDITNLVMTDERFPEDGIIGNTELEMSIETAEWLIQTLQAAIRRVQACDYQD
ncbi:MAG: hypothetical protein Q8K52_02270, partial [Thiobacillus sp.]|nr:hypothetical protein [Thiobacillus sp.]